MSDTPIQRTTDPAALAAMVRGQRFQVERECGTGGREVSETVIQPWMHGAAFAIYPSHVVNNANERLRITLIIAQHAPPAPDRIIAAAKAVCENKLKVYAAGIRYVVDPVILDELSAAVAEREATK